GTADKSPPMAGARSLRAGFVRQRSCVDHFAARPGVKFLDVERAVGAEGAVGRARDITVSRRCAAATLVTASPRLTAQRAPRSGKILQTLSAEWCRCSLVRPKRSMLHASRICAAGNEVRDS